MTRLMMIVALLFTLVGCTPAAQTTVNNVEQQAIMATQEACIVSSALVTAPEVALVCGIVEEGEALAVGMTQFIEDLINVRQTQVAAGKTFDVAHRTWVMVPPTTVAPVQP